MENDNTLDEPIINSPFEEPRQHWNIRPHEPAVLVGERRSPTYNYVSPSVRNDENGYQSELPLVSLIREQLKAWRPQALKGGGGVTGVTMTLLQHWQREDREQRLFFAQREAAETIIFLTEARADFLQGIDVPLDELSDAAKRQEITDVFRRRCCRMATGAGKTTVMGMLAAWSILNKVNNRQDKRFSDAVLVICPNVTIRSRLSELKPSLGDASIYRTRDLVPSALMPQLQQGKVHIINWHLLELRSTQASNRVQKTGRRQIVREEVWIGDKKYTARGKRYMTIEDIKEKHNLDKLTVVGEEKGKDGVLKRVWIESEKYVETDTAFVKRVLDKELGSKRNILVFNDEAHHAYRLYSDKEEDDNDLFGEEENAKSYYQEATVWVEGLDKIHKARTINFCADFSATPYFLGAKAGGRKNRIFPWTVSSFGLEDAIEAGIVKIPQLAVRDTTGKEIPDYSNIWEWILEQLTATERGGRRSEAKPQAILKYAHIPIAMLAGSWEEQRSVMEKSDDKRPPVLIIVCKTTNLAKMIFEWLAEDKLPKSIPSADIPSLQNSADKINTIRVDSVVQKEIDSGNAKTDEVRWMRHTLDTIGKSEWVRDRQGQILYPDGFEDLAKKLERPTHPPGRDVRCIVSVGMLTEGWDCNTVTHIIGLRPFMSQLLCEQVIGRGLRRMSYEVGDDELMHEEIATILGVPLRTFPVKATGKGAPAEIRPRYHIYALPERAALEIKIPRVESYRQGDGGIPTCNVERVPIVHINPEIIPSRVEMGPGLLTKQGTTSLHAPGHLSAADLDNFRRERRLQERIFMVTKEWTTKWVGSQDTADSFQRLPENILFWHFYKIIEAIIQTRVKVTSPGDINDIFLSPYYGRLIEILEQYVEFEEEKEEEKVPELPRYESPRGECRTGDIVIWTVRKPYNVIKSHVNAVVPDTKWLEQRAAHQLDTHPFVQAFVKNEKLGFGIPYFYNGETHDYMPDFVIRLQNNEHLILEMKGYDELKEVKREAANRWVKAVNADGQYGVWHYRMAEAAGQVAVFLNDLQHQHGK